MPSNSQKQTWILKFDPTRNFSIQTFQKDDGSYGASLSHRFVLVDQFTSAVKNRKGSGHPAPVIQELRVHVPDNIVSEARKKRVLRRLRKGREFNYAELRQAADTLASDYKKKGYLNAVINPKIEFLEENKVSIDMNEISGEPLEILFQGDALSGKMRRKAVRNWNGRLPEDIAASQARKNKRSMPGKKEEK